MNLWAKKPSDDRSVTLTLVVISGTALLVASCLEMAGLVKDTSVLLEAFWGCLANYLGGKFTFKGQSYEASKEQK